MKTIPLYLIRLGLLAGVCLLATAPSAAQKDPKQTAANTIAIKLAEPVRLQTLSKPVKFYIGSVVDRSGNPQPILVLRPRGGIYLDREPKAIVQEAMEQSLTAGGALASDQESADFILSIYVFHFGLGEGSGMEFYGKVELTVLVKNPKTGKSVEVPGFGTSIQGTAVRKKNILANVKENLETALSESLRNFLRGTKLRDTVKELGE